MTCSRLTERKLFTGSTSKRCVYGVLVRLLHTKRSNIWKK